MACPEKNPGAITQRTEQNGERSREIRHRYEKIEKAVLDAGTLQCDRRKKQDAA